MKILTTEEFKETVLEFINNDRNIKLLEEWHEECKEEDERKRDFERGKWYFINTYEDYYIGYGIEQHIISLAYSHGTIFKDGIIEEWFINHDFRGPWQVRMIEVDMPSSILFDFLNWNFTPLIKKRG